MKNKVSSLNTYLYLSFLHFLDFAELNTFFFNDLKAPVTGRSQDTFGEVGVTGSVFLPFRLGSATSCFLFLPACVPV